ncbi:glycosyltransferase family 2 protein [Psychrobacter sanguinis]|uniref:glycosyltransferase family 2 protein n=1 Tax=Psychrobacter sanguinis TaxID=861445 RepID=UPI00020C7A2B|nr:glycosyltransferase [Psychrobacter sanguinis]EGK13939.1 glycosyl transferase family protein [Psychrobacter sp. 1501(2011)]MCD9150521.1 glycosyltransferase [Psychrobacter sanguinis]
MYKLSIIIPVYNVEKYIEDCINSLINQLPSEVQVIVVNDGSPDKSFELAKSLVLNFKPSKIDQFLFIEQENQGLSGARNTGIRSASGEYIGFLDSDDKLLEGYFDSVFKYINSSRYDIIDFNLITSEGTLKKVRESNVDSIESVFKTRLWYSWARIVKKELLINYQFTPGIYYEDIALTPLLYIQAKNTLHIEEPLYWYRTNEDGITLNKTNDNSEKTIHSFQLILNNYLEIYNVQNDEFLVPIIMQLYYLLCTTCTLRFGVVKSFKFVNEYKPYLMKLGFEEKIKHNSMINIRTYQFYLHPHIYLPFFKTAVYTRDKFKSLNKN